MPYSSTAALNGAATALATNQSTSVRLVIYGAGLPPAASSQNSLVVNVTQVFNVLPVYQLAQILPVDNSIDDTQVKFLQIGKDLQAAGKHIWSGTEDGDRLSYINKNSVARSMEDNGKKDMPVHISNEVFDINEMPHGGYDYKSAIYNSGLSEQNQRIENLNNSHFSGGALQI